MRCELNVKQLFFWLFVTVFLLLVYYCIGQMMRVAEEVESDLAFELMAAVMGSIVTVAAMAIMMKVQIQQDKEREFSTQLFEKKIDIYERLLQLIFTMDDDGTIQREEIQAIENHIGSAALVANRDLVSSFAQFLYQLKVYGVMYFRNMTPKQLEHFKAFVTEEQAKTLEKSKLANHIHQLELPIQGNEINYFLSLDDFIQGLRADLAVVEGDVKHDIEHFVRTPIDQFKLFKNPNNVD